MEEKPEMASISKPEMASISKQELASHIAVQTDYELKDGRFARLLVATGSSDLQIKNSLNCWKRKLNA